METTVNSKSTKAEILEVLKKAEKKISDFEKLKENPIKQAQKTETIRAVESANVTIANGVFSDELTDSYTDLLFAIEEKQKTLKDLFGIEVSVNTMVSMIEANNIKEFELDEKYNTQKKEIDKRLLDKKLVIEQEITDLNKSFENIKKENSARDKDYNDDIQKNRKREGEEYQYKLTRNRDKINDEWTDECEERKRCLANKEKELAVSLEDIAKREEVLNDLNNKIIAIPELLKQSFSDGEKSIETSLNKLHYSNKSLYEKEAEFKLLREQDKNARLEEQVVNLTTANQLLEEKLNNSYSEIKELASDTVNANARATHNMYPTPKST